MQTATDISTVPSSTVVELKGATHLPQRSPTPAIEILAPGHITTPRLMLRPLRGCDRAEFLRVVRLSRETFRGPAALHRPSESDDQLFERQLALAEIGETRGTAWRRVAVLHDGRIAGAVNLSSISRGLTFEAEANWWTAADCAGRGLATEAVQAMLDYALAERPVGLGLHQINASICSDNAASRSVARKAGMQATGRAVSIESAGVWYRLDVWQRAV